MAKNKDKKIYTPALQVDDEVIIYRDSFICIKNISLISISEIPSNTSWIWAIIIGLLGIYLQSQSELGMYLIISAIIWFIIVMVYNANRGDNLAISLNSGTTLYFNCKDRKFLVEVTIKLLNSIKENSHSRYTISFSQCTINDGVLNGSLIN